MNPFRIRPLKAALIGLAASACGGGGGGLGLAVSDNMPVAGISGSGFITSGTIDSFGSIFVNGVEYETDGAQITLDGEDSSEDRLGIGMVVIVQGTLNDDGITGSAEQVIFNDAVEGPISAIQSDPDGDSKLLSVLGVDVIVERTGTVFENITFDTLAVGDVIEVSGYPESGNNLRATRVEKKSDFVAGQTEVEAKGVVSNLDASQFSLGAYIVDYSNADLSELRGGALADGQMVEVYGTLQDQLITATRIEEESDITDYLDDDSEFSVQGAIDDFVGSADFQVDGVRVDAGNAILIPSGLNLADGVVVEVDGSWNGRVLTADRVEARRGRIEIEAAVISVDSGGGTVTLGLFGGNITVQIDAGTLLDDDTRQAYPLTLGDISSGDFLEVEAILLDDGTLVATRIDRDETDDEVLQAPVESFNAGTDITLLGITYSIAGAEFEGFDDTDLSADAFFSQLQVGDLVKIKDEEVADGVADEIEFENSDRPDGGVVFEDDDDSDDESDSDEDDSDDSVDEPESEDDEADDSDAEDEPEAEEEPEVEEESEAEEEPEEEPSEEREPESETEDNSVETP